MAGSMGLGAIPGDQMEAEAFGGERSTETSWAPAAPRDATRVSGSQFEQVEDSVLGRAPQATDQTTDARSGRASQESDRDARYAQWERQLAEREQRLQAMLEQVVSRYTAPQPTPQETGQQTGAPDFVSIEGMVDKDVFDKLDGQTKATIRAIDRANQENLERIRSQFPQTQPLANEVQEMRAKLQQFERAQQITAWKQQAAQVIRTYGKDAVAPHATRIAEMLDQNPSMSVEEALFRVSPSTVLNHARELGRREALSERDRGRLAGDIFSGIEVPSNMPTKREYVPGESMQDSVHKVLASLTNGRSGTGGLF